MRALIFTSRDLPDVYAAARDLVVALSQDKIAAELIDKRSSNPRALLLVAEYGAVEPVLFVLLDANGLRARLTALPSRADVQNILNHIH